MRVAAAALLLPGCVVPIPGEEEATDGGVNSPPVIVASVPSMPFEGGGPINVTSLPAQVTIDVKDVDLDDQIYVRVFRDYESNPLQIVEEREQIPPTGTAIRAGIALDTLPWCLGAPTGMNLVFDVVVADRPFLEDDTEPFNRATSGESSVRAWIGVCSAE